jgi:hypothetical protein
MLWVPTTRALSVIEADPEVSATGVGLSCVAPSKKSMPPVAVAGVTLAVRVTGWPYVEGLAVEVSAVVVDVAAEACPPNTPRERVAMARAGSSLPPMKRRADVIGSPRMAAVGRDE